MGTFIDYIGSLLIAGVMTLIVFSLNASMTQTSFTRTNEQVSQNAATNMLRILQTDFYKAGYRVTAREKISVAESLRCTFVSDIDNVGAPATIAYAVGDSTQLTATWNVHDRPLFRKLNSNPSVNIINGMTKCYFAYYDTGGYLMKYSSLGDSAGRAVVRGIGLTLTVEPGNPNDTTYIPVKMTRTIWPKNLGVW